MPHPVFQRELGNAKFGVRGELAAFAPSPIMVVDLSEYPSFLSGRITPTPHVV